MKNKGKRKQKTPKRVEERTVQNKKEKGMMLKLKKRNKKHSLKNKIKTVETNKRKTIKKAKE